MYKRFFPLKLSLRNVIKFALLSPKGNISQSIPALFKYCEDFAIYGGSHAGDGWGRYFHQEVANDFNCQYFLPPKSNVDDYTHDIVSAFLRQENSATYKQIDYKWEKRIIKWY